jgi:hypothetical protein
MDWALTLIIVGIVIFMVAAVVIATFSDGG